MNHSPCTIAFEKLARLTYLVSEHVRIQIRKHYLMAQFQYYRARLCLMGHYKWSELDPNNYDRRTRRFIPRQNNSRRDF